jgi:hypothetical protein
MATPLPTIATNTEETAFAVLEGNVILDKVNIAISDMSNKMTTSIGHLTGAFMSFSQMIKDQNAAMLAKASLSADNTVGVVDPSGAGAGAGGADPPNVNAGMGDIMKTIKSLGFWGVAIVGGLALSGGLILGQIENIKTYGRLIKNIVNTIGDIFKGITPDFIKGPLGSLKNNLTLSFGQFAEFIAETFAPIKEKFGKIATYVDEIIGSIRASISGGFDKFVKYFSFAEDSDLGKIFSRVGTVLEDFTKPFKTAIETITNMISAEGPAGKIGTVMDEIFGYLGKFGAMFGTIAKVIGKIFAPIAIIMTLFDVITATIEGFAEGGIIGGLKGAIDGLFDSLIGAPLKMLTDAAAWVLGKLGFDDAAASLSSFDPSALWNQMTTAIFDGIGAAITWVKSFFVFNSEGETEEGPGFISQLVTDAWGSIKQWFSDALAGIADALPSWDDITAGIISALPSWMVPDSFKTPGMIAAEIKTKIAENQALVDQIDSGQGGNKGWMLDSVERSRAAEQIIADQAALAELEATRSKQDYGTPGRGGNGGSPPPASTTQNNAGNTVIMQPATAVGGRGPHRKTK